jgi:hypothetical protein
VEMGVEVDRWTWSEVDRSGLVDDEMVALS